MLARTMIVAFDAPVAASAAQAYFTTPTRSANTSDGYMDKKTKTIP